MMRVEKVYPKGFAANCYLVTENGRDAVAVDPAQPRVLGRARELGFNVRYVLLTHGHFDHIGGCAALQEAGAKVGCLDIERALALGNDNMGTEFGVWVPKFSVDFTFRGGDVLDLCGISFRVLATPGHTAGSCSFLAGDALFTGDTLFAGDCGRTDLPTGSAGKLRESLKLLFGLDGDYTVYAGHGEDTTLQREREHADFLM